MSMIIAITVIPVACSYFLTSNTSPPSRFGLYRLGQAFGALVMSFVNWLLQGLFRRIALIVGVIVIVVMILDQLTPKAEYFPEGEEKKIFVRIFSPPDYNIEQMHTIAKDVNTHYAPHIGIDPTSYQGEENEMPPLDYLVVFVSSSATFFVVEANEQKNLNKLIEVSEEYAKKFPGVITFVSRGSIFSSNSGGTRSINLNISGRDLEQLYEVGLKSFIRSEEIFDQPRVRPQPSSLTLGQPMIEVRPDWERVAELGIDADELGYTIWAYSDGAFVDEYFEGDKKIDMFLYSIDGVIQSPADINHLMLYSNEGGIVPLSVVASVDDTVNTETIRRVDSRRTITLSIIPPADVPLEEGVSIVKRDLIQYMKDSGKLGNGITMNIAPSLTGQFYYRGFYCLSIIGCNLFALGLSLNHYEIGADIGISGGIVGLWLVNFFGARLDQIGLQNINQPFDMITMLGFLILIGTAVNNPILLVERTMKNIHQRGMDYISAIRESTESRLRPIMMSTITTIAGLSPLVFNPGAGTELYRGLGAIVLFGLLFSTIVTLTFIPCLMSLVLQLRKKLIDKNNDCWYSAEPPQG